MTLFCWYQNTTFQHKNSSSNNHKHTLNQAMWPTAQVRDSLLSNHHLPNKKQLKSGVSYEDNAELSMVRRG